jgi:SAM-dependent methyltransferase
MTSEQTSRGHAIGRRERYAPSDGDRIADESPRRRAEREADFFLPHLRPGMRLLDAGAGTGAITLDLAAAVAPGEVVGIDIEPQQVERARALAIERGVPNVRFEVGDVYAMAFPDGSFDAVFAHAVLIHLRDPLAALTEVRRVLRPGGVAGSRDVTNISFREPTTPLLEEFSVILRHVTEHHRGRPAAGLDFQQRRLLLEAGFTRAEGYVQVDSFGTAETVRRRGMRYATFLGETFRQTVLDKGWADAAKLDAIVAELRAWAERPDSFGCELWCTAVGWVDAG